MIDSISMPLNVHSKESGYAKLNSGKKNESELAGRALGRPIQLVIGLDFGTSFSKVVIGEPRIRYAVRFHEYCDDADGLLLPSAIHVAGDNGECSLGVGHHSGHNYDNLKMPLIQRNVGSDVQVRAAAFLALVLRHSRRWLLEEYGSTYNERKIEWFINIGVPTDNYDDQVLTTTYCAVVQAAWKVSFQDEIVTLGCVQEALDRVQNHRIQAERGEVAVESQLPFDRINAFPEFAAQIVGYVRSPRRREGLHVTVDVGGGTLDVTVYNIHEVDGEDAYPIFARKVEPLGVRYLAARRLRILPPEVNQLHSPFQDLPTISALVARFDVTREQIMVADQPVAKGVVRAVGESLLHTKKHRYPNAPQWDLGSRDLVSSRYGEAIPAFFCGGGSLSEFYSDLLSGFAGKNPPFKIRRSELPVPSDLDVQDIGSGRYGRFAVAYGLSFDPFDIGRISRMEEVEDVHEEVNRSSYEDRYIGKEKT